VGALSVEHGVMVSGIGQVACTNSKGGMVLVLEGKERVLLRSGLWLWWNSVVQGALSLLMLEPKDIQDSGETLSQAHGKLCKHSKAGLVPYALSVQHREQHTSTEESWDEVQMS